MTGGGREAVEELLRVASRIERLRRLGRQRFDEDELVRLALQRLWIALGEAARRYCEAEGVGAGMPPWADMIAFATSSRTCTSVRSATSCSGSPERETSQGGSGRSRWIRANPAPDLNSAGLMRVIGPDSQL